MSSSAAYKALYIIFLSRSELVRSVLEQGLSSYQKGGSAAADSTGETLRMIRGLGDMTYKERLKELGYLA